MKISFIQKLLSARSVLQQIPDKENDADMLTKIITARLLRTKAARLLGDEVVG